MRQSRLFTFFITLALLMAMVVACAEPSPTWTPIPTPTPTPPTPIPEYPPKKGPLPSMVEFKGIPEKASYEVGDLVLLECSFTNISTGPIVVHTFSSPVKIHSMYRGTPVRELDNEMYEIKLGPGETKTYELTWDQKDDIGKQVDYGWYWVEVAYKAWKDTESRGEQIGGGRNDIRDIDKFASRTHGKGY